MNGKRVGWMLALGATMFVGCDSGSDAPANPPATPAAPAPPAPDVTPKSETSGTGTGAPAPSASADPTGADAGASTTTTPDPKEVGGGKSGESPADASDEGAGKVKEANEHIAATIQHLKDNKPDLARQSLRKAEALQDSLPTTTREEIKTLRVNVDKSSKSEPLPSPTDEENK